MSSEIAISTIETVKKKLEKYDATQDLDKVNEYLRKLHNTTITPALIQETKIDVLINKLASNTRKSYCSTAQSLLKKWQQKNLLPNTMNNSKNSTVTHTNKQIPMKKVSAKRKSNDYDNTIHVHPSSESQSSDDFKSIDGGQSSSTKKRRVLSLAEYVGNKKPIVNSSITTDVTEEKFTDTQIKEIYAQFDAKCEEVAASVPNLAINVNKKLKQADIIIPNRNDIMANGHGFKAPIDEQPKTKYNDIWAEDDDDDDDSDNAISSRTEQKIIKQPQPVKNKQSIKHHNLDTQQLIAPSSTSKIQDDKKAMTLAISSTLNSIDYPKDSLNLSRSRPAATKQQPSESYNFLRSKRGHQAIYSGKRVTRTSIPSLQELCVETLKDHVEDICHTHFNRLPYELVKPIIDVSTPDQLQAIIDNNPDYTDDVEPLWQNFCQIYFKDAKRKECETYFELYLRKYNENEERLQRYTDLAKRKKAETIDTARQTKKLNMPQRTSRISNNSSTKITRQVVNLPSSSSHRGQTKAKKPSIPPLLKKALKVYNGKN